MSMRTKKEGSWFMQKLCKHVKTYAHQEDFINILTRTFKDINDLSTGARKKFIHKHMPCFFSTLLKKFYLCKERERMLNISDINEQYNTIVGNIEDTKKELEKKIDTLEEIHEKIASNNKKTVKTIVESNQTSCANILGLIEDLKRDQRETTRKLIDVKSRQETDKLEEISRRKEMIEMIETKHVQEIEKILEVQRNQNILHTEQMEKIKELYEFLENLRMQELQRREEQNRIQEEQKRIREEQKRIREEQNRIREEQNRIREEQQRKQEVSDVIDGVTSSENIQTEVDKTFEEPKVLNRKYQMPWIYIFVAVFVVLVAIICAFFWRHPYFLELFNQMK